MDDSARQALFISHANPEDNAFTLWLGAKLTALGYEVFADVLRIKGGDDWERILENAIRNRAVKFLLVATPQSVQKQGVRNEITIANETAKKIKDDAFIIPLRLAPYDSPLLVAHAQYVDFEKGWSQGLAELLLLLAEVKVPQPGDQNNLELWRSIQLKDARTISSRAELLVSNWLAVESMPDRILFYDFKGGISIGAAQEAIRNCPVPVVPFNRGFLSFAPLPQLQGYFGPDLPLVLVTEKPTKNFLENGWSEVSISRNDARAKFSDLARRALDALFEAKGLTSFEMASGRLAWWPTASLATTSQLSFAWQAGPSGRRQLVGHSKKRGIYWHYGVSCWARTLPLQHVRVIGRVIFTSNGYSPIGDDRRTFRMRRSFCKSWRNDKWRDLLLAFWYWLSGGMATIDAPFGDGVALRLRLPPMIFEAPFGVESATDQESGLEDEEEDEVVSESGDEKLADDEEEFEEMN